MTILTPERNYIPIDIETKFHACSRRVVSKWPIRKIISFYHIKRSSLYRWLKKFDGTKESLLNRSHRPLTEHPKKINNDLSSKILNLHRRNPDQSYIEIWARLKHDNINISLSSVLRILKRNGIYVAYKPNKKKKHDKKYHTPKMPHEKWQVDVKFVPNECKSDKSQGRYFQYTILDECTRKRILYFTNEHSMYETVKALEMASEKFGCFPKEIQTDNGFEFTDKALRKENGSNIRNYDNLLERFALQITLYIVLLDQEPQNIMAKLKEVIESIKISFIDI